MRKDIADLKKVIEEHIKAQAEFEDASLTYRAGAREVVAELQKKVNEHNGRLERIEKVVERLTMTDAIIRVIGGLLMASLIALVWSIITHQVTLGF